MLDMYGNNFYFVPFSCLTLACCWSWIITRVSLSGKGTQLVNSGGCLPVSVPAAGL